jgi:hypothetical protein
VGPPQTLPLDSRYDENVNLCPRTTGTADYVRRLVDRVMQTYQPDGLWLDFQDMIPFQCEAPHSHPVTFGEGYTATAAAIRDAALSHGAIPTVQVRYPVANLNNKPFDAMSLYNMVMRPFSSGIVMGTDEMYWPPSASTVTAAKFVATTVFSGVPAIGANFDKSPRAHSDVVRAWLDFYKAHREGLTQGRFEPIGDFVRPDQKIESSNQAFVYLRYGATSTLFFRGVSSVFIANSTDTSNLRLELRGLVTGRYLVTVRDIYLRSVSSWNLDVSGGSSLTASVPEGGMVEMLRQF